MILQWDLISSITTTLANCNRTKGAPVEWFRNHPWRAGATSIPFTTDNVRFLKVLSTEN